MGNLYHKTSSSCLFYCKNDAFDYLATYITSFFIKKKKKTFHLSCCSWVVSSCVSFIHQESSSPVCKDHSGASVGPGVFCPLSGISCRLSLCKHGLSRGNGMFTSKPGPSVVSDLDGGCTWANGAFSKQCLARPPDKGLPLKQIL